MKEHRFKAKVIHDKVRDTVLLWTANTASRLLLGLAQPSKDLLLVVTIFHVSCMFSL